MYLKIERELEMKKSSVFSVIVFLVAVSFVAMSTSAHANAVSTQGDSWSGGGIPGTPGVIKFQDDTLHFDPNVSHNQYGVGLSKIEAFVIDDYNVVNGPQFSAAAGQFKAPSGALLNGWSSSLVNPWYTVSIGSGLGGESNMSWLLNFASQPGSQPQTHMELVMLFYSDINYNHQLSYVGGEIATWDTSGTHWTYDFNLYQEGVRPADFANMRSASYAPPNMPAPVPIPRLVAAWKRIVRFYRNQAEINSARLAQEEEYDAVQEVYGCIIRKGETAETLVDRIGCGVLSGCALHDQ